MSNQYELLKQWNELLKNGTITQEEFDALKSELLGTKEKNKNLKKQLTKKTMFL